MSLMVRKATESYALLVALEGRAGHCKEELRPMVRSLATKLERSFLYFAGAAVAELRAEERRHVAGEVLEDDAPSAVALGTVLRVLTSGEEPSEEEPSGEEPSEEEEEPSGEEPSEEEEEEPSGEEPSEEEEPSGEEEPSIPAPFQSRAYQGESVLNYAAPAAAVSAVPAVPAVSTMPAVPAVPPAPAPAASSSRRKR